jgi:hypothetical protein
MAGSSRAKLCRTTADAASVLPVVEAALDLFLVSRFVHDQVLEPDLQRRQPRGIRLRTRSSYRSMVSVSAASAISNISRLSGSTDTGRARRSAPPEGDDLVREELGVAELIGDLLLEELRGPPADTARMARLAKRAVGDDRLVFRRKIPVQSFEKFVH